MAATDLKFGPEWLHRQTSSQTGGGNNTEPPSPSFGGKFKLAENRYGREEMLALFAPTRKPASELKDRFPELCTDKCLYPLAFVPLSQEEQTLLSGSVNSTNVRGRGSSERSGIRGTGRGVRGGRGRGRGDNSFGGRGMYDEGGARALGESRGRGAPKVIDTSGFLSARHYEEAERRTKDPFSRSMPGDSWREMRRQDSTKSASGDQEEGGEANDGDWRRAGNDRRPRGNWRVARPSYDDDPRGGFTARGGFNRQTSYERRVNRYNSRHDDERDEMPEWAVEDGHAEEMTFDDGGQFMSVKDLSPKKDKTTTESKSPPDNPQVKETDEEPQTLSEQTASQSTNKLKDNSKTNTNKINGSSEMNPSSSISTEDPGLKSLQPMPLPPRPEVPPLDLSKTTQQTTADSEPDFSHVTMNAEKILSMEDEEEVSVEEPVEEAETGEVSWFYKDPSQTVQGPFTPADMDEWFHAGYFNLELEIKTKSDKQFQILGERLKQWRESGVTPFYLTPAQMMPLSSGTPLMNSDPAILAQSQPNFAQPNILSAQQRLLQQQQQQQLQRQLIDQNLTVMAIKYLKQIPEFQFMSERDLQVSLANPQVQELLKSIKQRLQSQTAQISTHQQTQRPNISVQQLLSQTGVLSQPGVTPTVQATTPTHTETTSIWDIPNQDAWRRQQQQRTELEQHQRNEIELMKLRLQEQQSKEEQQRRDREAAEQQRREMEEAEKQRRELEEKRHELEEKQRREREAAKLEQERQEAERQEAERLEKLKMIKEMERLKMEEKLKAEQEAEERRAEEIRREQEEQKRKEREEKERRKREAEEQARVQAEREKQAAIERERERELKEQQERERLEREKQAEIERLQDIQLPSTALWASYNGSSTQSQASNLQEILRKEAEEAERERKKQAAEAAARAREQQQLQQETQANLKWAAALQSPKQQYSHQKSLREIQEEEARQLAEAAKNQPKQTAAPSTQLSWAAKSVGWTKETAWANPQKTANVVKTPNTEVFPSLATNKPPGKPQPVQPPVEKKQKPVQKKKEKERTEKIVQLFKNPKSASQGDEMSEWCKRVLANICPALDGDHVDNFLMLLNECESPDDIQSFVHSNLGKTQPVNKFIKDFIDKRSQANKRRQQTENEDSLWGPAPAVNPSVNRANSNEFTMVQSNQKKKGKKAKGQKMDATALLGFNVGASSNRFNVGEIEKGE